MGVLRTGFWNLAAENDILGLIDGEQKTLSEVSRRLRITRERVRQIEKAALEKLQSRLIVSGEERRRVS